ncbi:hypothetical protein B0H10DRAFT_1939189 [Mycena sp. CBHHK59/15]|nr:hypothetical protein B0H10DRAFT_1939189 [Mycena sp. CBHHK59/15]
MTKTNAVETINFLVTSLLNPMAPESLCAIGIANGCNILFEPSSKIKYNSILRAGMLFLGKDRSQDDHRKLLNTLTICNCNMKNSTIYALHDHMSVNDYLDFIIVDLTFALVEAISSKAGHLRKTNKKIAEQLDQPWPNNVHDLFPSSNAYKGTLQNLMRWVSDTNRGSGIFLLISRLGSFSYEFAVETFRDASVIPTIVAHLGEAIIRHEAALPKDTYRIQLASCTQFLRRMETRHFVLLLFKASDSILSIARRIQPALDILPTPESTATKEWWNTLLHGIGAIPKFDWDIDGLPKLQTIPKLEGNSTQTYRFLRIHRSRNVCMHPPCPNQSNIKETMFCRRCGIARYCGSECQAFAWKADNAPHKEMCDAVRILRRTMGLEDDAKWKEIMLPCESSEKMFTTLCTNTGVQQSTRTAILAALNKHSAAMWTERGPL